MMMMFLCLWPSTVTHILFHSHNHLPPTLRVLLLDDGGSWVNHCQLAANLSLSKSLIISKLQDTGAQSGFFNSAVTDMRSGCSALFTKGLKTCMDCRYIDIFLFFLLVPWGLPINMEVMVCIFIWHTFSRWMPFLPQPSPVVTGLCNLSGHLGVKYLVQGNFDILAGGVGLRAADRMDNGWPLYQLCHCHPCKL